MRVPLVEIIKVLSIIGLGIGLFILGRGLWAFYLDYFAPQWPTIEATVTNSSVFSYSGAHHNTYNVEIRYNYTFGNSTYSGICCVNPENDTGYLARTYIPGSKAQIYMNPHAPDQSIMKDDVHPLDALLSIGYCVLGLAFIIASISVFTQVGKGKGGMVKNEPKAFITD